MSIRIAAWNLGHQTSDNAPIHPQLLAAVQEIAPDVLVLNEFVDVRREQLRAGLTAIGLPHVASSRRHNRHNQVLIASREPFSVGPLAGPEMEGGAGQSNFLHVVLPDGLHVVGVRAPTYQGAELHAYWRSLFTLIDSTRELPIVWIGDLNADPDLPASKCGRYLAELEAQGWVIPRASGRWSFHSGSRIDHAVLSHRVACTSAEYVTAVGGVEVVGRLDSSGRFISDHAALVVQVRAAQTHQS